MPEPKLQIQLNRDLRRIVLRGEPWIYRDSIVQPPQLNQAQLCQVIDRKKEFLGWAIYDPHSPLCLRFVSLEKKPPQFDLFQKRFEAAFRIRKNMNRLDTNSFRLFNGEGDLLPGLVCDVYDQVAVLQFDGQGANEFWDKPAVAKWLIDSKACITVVEKLRRQSEGGLKILAGTLDKNIVTAKENGVHFRVDLENGQKTGFFLDQRENRQYIREMSKGVSLLNLFSYSGGFSVYAGMGGAKKVSSVDMAQGAIDLANENWELNGLDTGKHQGVCADVFDFLKEDQEMWEHIIVDPPSMGHSEEHKNRARMKYIELFAAAAKRVKPQGQLSLSSCSSHISFTDFYEIITEALSESRRRGQILRVSGQGADHPFLHSSQKMQYLKFVHLILN